MSRGGSERRARRWGAARAGLALVAAPLVLVLGSCTQPTGDRHPVLPVGFAESQVPNVPFNTYVYVNPGQPITFSPKSLNIPQEQAGELAAQRLVMWMGSSKDALGLQVTLTEEPAAQGLETAVADVTDLWSSRQGAQVTMVRGTGDWSTALRSAIESGSVVSFRETYPEAWENVLLLPQSAPKPVIAAGVLLVDDAFLTTLGESQTADLKSLGTALRSASAKSAAFAVYGDKSLTLPEKIDIAYMRDSQMRMVIALRTRLVGPILSGVLNTLAGALKLEKVDMGGREVLRYQQGDVTALLVPRGSTLYVVVAPGGAAPGEDLLAYLDPEEPKATATP